MLAILDTGPLVAALDRDDPAHIRSVAVLRRTDIQLAVPILVIAEAAYFVNRQLGPTVEAQFIFGLNQLEIFTPHPHGWTRISEIVSRYQGFPLGSVDASVVALAEQLETDLIITLDQRHFRAVRPQHVTAFRLLPEP